MKKVNTILCLFAVTLFFAACGGNDYPEKDNSIVTPETNNTEVPVTTVGEVMNEPVNVQTMPAPTISTNSNSIPPSTGKVNTAGLNPAHGEPGHRCDISVGAPLNAPKTTSTPQPVQTITTPATTPITTGINTGKLNPPHGEPGHDCSVTVGAPLKN